MSDNKVVLPREVAEAIDTLEKSGCSPYQILSLAEGAIYSEPHLAIQSWAFKRSGGSPELLMRALVNGYTAEATPEEKVREYYERLDGGYIDSTRDSADRSYYEGGKYAIQETLNLLGITIEGVNG